MIFVYPPSVLTFCFVYEMILDRCKSKSYTVLLKNKFFAPNFLEMVQVGKISALYKITFTTQLVFSNFFLFFFFFCHDCKLCACFQFDSCTVAKQWCIHQSVNVCTNFLRQYLKWGWLNASQHVSLEHMGSC